MVEVLEDREVESESEVQQDPDEKRVRRCLRCDNPITDNRQVIEVEGFHEHCQANPAGYVFLFGCFSDAPGCDIIGDPTAEHSWFPAYRWQLATCDQCQVHLGWYFRSTDDGFFGLLLNRLTRD